MQPENAPMQSKYKEGKTPSNDSEQENTSQITPTALTISWECNFPHFVKTAAESWLQQAKQELEGSANRKSTSLANEDLFKLTQVFKSKTRTNISSM